MGAWGQHNVSSPCDFYLGSGYPLSNRKNSPQSIETCSLTIKWVVVFSPPHVPHNHRYTNNLSWFVKTFQDCPQQPTCDPSMFVWQNCIYYVKFSLLHWGNTLCSHFSTLCKWFPKSQGSVPTFLTSEQNASAVWDMLATWGHPTYLQKRLCVRLRWHRTPAATTEAYLPAICQGK